MFQKKLASLTALSVFLVISQIQSMDHELIQSSRPQQEVHHEVQNSLDIFEHQNVPLFISSDITIVILKKTLSQTDQFFKDYKSLCCTCKQLRSLMEADTIKALVHPRVRAQLSPQLFGLLASGQEGKLEKARQLIENGADKNVKNHDGTPLIFELLADYPTSNWQSQRAMKSRGIEVLLQTRPRDNAQVIECLTKSLHTPLMVAAMQGKSRLVSLFIKLGANVNQKHSQDNTTALHHAAWGEKKDTPAVVAPINIGSY